MSSRIKYSLISIIAFICVSACFGGWMVYHFYSRSNPGSYQKIGDIPVPKGFTRTEKNGYSNYLRHIPLRRKGTKVKLFSGAVANYQTLNYAVLDVPLISNWEQCADACIRLRSEYLYQSGLYGKISFKDVNGKISNYKGGRNRKAFEKYLKTLYGVASTASMDSYLPQREFSEIQPGDVFVYKARKGNKYGHAVMVVDVAVNHKTGEKAFLIAEGNTPARDLHLLNNFWHPFSAPWFYLKGNEKALRIGPFLYYKNELRHF